MLNNLLKNIPENIRIIITSAGPLVIVIILFLIVGNFGINKVQGVRSQITEATTTQNILTQKLSLLQSVSSTLGNAPDVASSALPSSNSALTAISQLKKLGLLNLLTLTNVKSGTETKDVSGLSRADIAFEIAGSRAQIVAFVESIPTIAPITLVDSVKLNESAGEARATNGVKNFLAPPLSTFPSVNPGLTDFNWEEEKKIL